MKNSFKKALKIFKCLAIVFSVVFWLYMVYDDFVFIEQYGLKLEYIERWLQWFLVYFLAFALYFWGIATLVILAYHKIVKPARVI